MPALSCCARISGAISDHTTGDRPGGYSAASGNGRSTCDLRRSGFLQWHPPCLRIVTALHQEFPALTYDVTIKVEHLLKHAEYLQILRDTGCLFVTTAVESLDDRTLALLEKGHTRADFLRVVELFRET